MLVQGQPPMMDRIYRIFNLNNNPTQTSFGKPSLRKVERNISAVYKFSILYVVSNSLQN